MPEYVRAISQQRLAERALGAADQSTLDEVEWWIATFASEPH